MSSVGLSSFRPESPVQDVDRPMRRVVMKICLIAFVTIAAGGLGCLFGLIYSISGAVSVGSAASLYYLFKPTALPAVTAKSAPFALGVGGSATQQIAQQSPTTKANLFPISRKTEEMSQEFPLAPSQKCPLIGIPNEGNTCFIAATLQMIMTDERLVRAFWEERLNGKTAEVGKFIHNYLTFGLQDKKALCNGVGAIRQALCRVTLNSEWLSGQHDAHDAFRALTSEKGIENRLKGLKDYYCDEVVYRTFTFDKAFKPVEIPGEDKQDVPGQHIIKTLHDEGGNFWIGLPSTGEYSFQAQFLKIFSPNEQIGDYQILVNQPNDIPTEVVGEYQTTKILWKSAPSQLQVHFKRFKKEPGQAPIRLDTSVTLPESLVVLGENFEKHPEKPNIGDQQYALRALVIHTGGLNGGHYYAYIKSNHKWYRMNDSRCEEVQDDIDFSGNPTRKAFQKILDEEKSNIYLARYNKSDF